MAVAMFAHFPGLTSERYDELMAHLDLDANPAPGAILHVAAEAEDGVNVVDLWQTKEAAAAFVEQRLNPVLSHLGIHADISIDVARLRNVFAPDLDTIGRIGAVSIPARTGGAPL
jgi:hypothetical protein